MTSLDEDQVVTLTSSDGRSFEVKTPHTNVSKMIRECLSGDLDATCVPLPSVSGNALEAIVRYMDFHKGEEAKLSSFFPILTGNDVKQVCTMEWDADFLDSLSKDLLYEVLLASLYLDIRMLYWLACAKVASLVKKKPLGEIRSSLLTKPLPFSETYPWDMDEEKEEQEETEDEKMN